VVFVPAVVLCSFWEAAALCQAQRRLAIGYIDHRADDALRLNPTDKRRRRTWHEHDKLVVFHARSLEELSAITAAKQGSGWDKIKSVLISKSVLMHENLHFNSKDKETLNSLDRTSDRTPEAQSDKRRTSSACKNVFAGVLRQRSVSASLERPLG
jgi:hypothetical protein